MNKMKMSAIVLGLAAAGAFAQTAPAAAPAAAQPAPAVQDSAKAAEEAKAIEAKKAEEEKAAAEAKKAEEEKAAAEAKKAEEEKKAAEAKKAEEEKAAAEAKKAEEEKKAAEAKQAEEAKTAEAAPAADNTNPGEVAAAANNAMSGLMSSLNEGTSKANMEVKFSGMAEIDAYIDDVLADGDIKHSYFTDIELYTDVKFNEKWTARLVLEAEANNAGTSIGYNSAYIQYKPAEVFYVKVGDLSFGEGAFVAYYDYTKSYNQAAGMKDHDIRGFQIGLAGLEVGLGLGRGGNDYENQVYDAHVAYEFNYAGQHLRPYFDYKSYQEEEHNELHAGIDAGLNIGGFGFRAVYGFHADYLGDDDAAKSLAGKFDYTSTAHTILVEPTFEVGMFDIKTTFFYAILNDGDRGNVAAAANNIAQAAEAAANGEDPTEAINNAAKEAKSGNEVSNDIPEYFFLYAEPAFKFAEFIKLGIPVEYHTHTLNSDDKSKRTFDVGARFYIDPVENLSITAFGMLDFAMGDNKDDTKFRLGVESVFNF